MDTDDPAFGGAAGGVDGEEVSPASSLVSPTSSIFEGEDSAEEEDDATGEADDDAMFARDLDAEMAALLSQLQPQAKAAKEAPKAPKPAVLPPRKKFQMPAFFTKSVKRPVPVLAKKVPAGGLESPAPASESATPEADAPEGERVEEPEASFPPPLPSRPVPEEGETEEGEAEEHEEDSKLHSPKKKGRPFALPPAAKSKAGPPVEGEATLKKPSPLPARKLPAPAPLPQKASRKKNPPMQKLFPVPPLQGSGKVLERSMQKGGSPFPLPPRVKPLDEGKADAKKTPSKVIWLPEVPVLRKKEAPEAKTFQRPPAAGAKAAPESEDGLAPHPEAEGPAAAEAPAQRKVLDAKKLPFPVLKRRLEKREDAGPETLILSKKESKVRLPAASSPAGVVLRPPQISQKIQAKPVKQLGPLAAKQRPPKSKALAPHLHRAEALPGEDSVGEEVAEDIAESEAEDAEEPEDEDAEEPEAEDDGEPEVDDLNATSGGGATEETWHERAASRAFEPIPVQTAKAHAKVAFEEDEDVREIGHGELEGDILIEEILQEEIGAHSDSDLDPLDHRWGMFPSDARWALQHQQPRYQYTQLLYPPGGPTYVPCSPHGIFAGVAAPPYRTLYRRPKNYVVGVTYTRRHQLPTVSRLLKTPAPEFLRKRPNPREKPIASPQDLVVDGALHFEVDLLKKRVGRRKPRSGEDAAPPQPGGHARAAHTRQAGAHGALW
ncbi:hypothetical protein BESB_031180 [Besnoitia besnoiti]|uniref:Uncharacterized protein n=1 Tax=Besnoitia besnoiti TaxID=94643 RepID=A0A2A9M1X3_BESBE|nr:hypothetical protein BESB_031180 [Besnoitia besnoiti]PFH31244.1 hypothetical protein BESB_031180 [Besnoitia besnoiti]